jgi:diamine N-acetyltransferase
MATVELRDIVTDADRAAALEIRRGPGQERFVSSVEKSFADAELYPQVRPRMWTVNDGDAVVGFVLISDGISADVMASNADIAGPYFLWRLLIDERQQRRGYGAATLDAIVAYLATRPGATTLYVSCGQGEGGPQPFYERYGFVPTGGLIDQEVVLALGLEAAT